MKHQTHPRAIEKRRVRPIFVILGVAVGLFVLPAFNPAPEATAITRSPLVTPPLAAFEPWEELPTELAAQVDSWTNRLLSTDHGTVAKLLSRRGAYGPLIEEQLRRRGMPTDLLYVAMVESGLRMRVMSPDSAVGMWQLRAATGRSLGLRIDDWVDERRDPVRSTEAALTYLQELRERFGSWPLAAAAYNAGPTRVGKRVRRPIEATESKRYWDVVRHLPRETRDYVPRILATRTLAQQAAELGVEVDYMERYEFDRVLVPAGTSLYRVAKRIGEPVSELRYLNPHFLRGVTPPGGAYPVRVPVGKGSEAVAALSAPGGSTT